jgi:hypothetical protein
MEIFIQIIIRPERGNVALEKTDAEIIEELTESLRYSFDEITGYTADEIEVDVERKRVGLKKNHLI